MTPMDPLFTSTFQMRSATIRALEKADPELLKLTGKARDRKIAELKTRRDNGEYLSAGESWFMHSAIASFTVKRAIGQRKEAAKIIDRARQRRPALYGGFNTKSP